MDIRVSRLSESFEDFQQLTEVRMTQKLWEEYSTPVEEKLNELEEKLRLSSAALPQTGVAIATGREAQPHHNPLPAEIHQTLAEAV